MRRQSVLGVNRNLVVLAAFVPAVLAAAVACSHPDQGQGPVGGGNSGDMTSGDNSSSGAGGGGASGDNAGAAGNGTGSGSGASSGSAGNTDNGSGTGSVNAGSGSGSGENASSGTASQISFDAGPSQTITDGAPPPVTKVACTNMAYSDPWTPGYTQDATVLASVQSTIKTMSLTQLANQMRGTTPGTSINGNYTDNFRTQDDTTAQVAGFAFRDGPRGVCLNAELASGNGYSTAFPVPSGRGATFDLALEEQVGEAIGDEMLASRTHFGKANTMLLAPVINILRHPAWGRAEETYGEDSFMLGRFGSAFTTGAQKYVAACAKHYAANNIENGRESENAIVDERTLREMYTRHFGAVIQDGGVACVMASYNLVNGTHATQNSHLLTDILRKDMGFKGFTMSDWWAIPPGQNFSSSTVLQGDAVSAISAELDMEMPWTFDYAEIESLVPGQLTGQQIQTSASRILEQKYRFKVAALSGAVGLRTPTTTFDSSNSIANNAAHIALAQKVALESMVLLKNSNNTLPIDRTKVKTVAVIGAQVPFTVSSYNSGNQSTIDFSTNVRLGDMGSSRVFSDPAKSTGPFQGVKSAAGSGITVVQGNTASAAANADFIVVVAGLTPQDEGEEYTGAGDRNNFALDDKNKTTTQNSLITAVAALKKPMVVVLEGGSVIDMPWLSSVPAVVMAWYPGMDGGTALGKLLFGDANFSGKLPVTWPKQWSDEPAFTGSTITADYHVGYSWFDNKSIQPLFAFGSGLSYTSFTYSYLTVPCDTVTQGGVVSVSVGVTNSGTVAGDEVGFMFVSYPSGVTRPAKELKGFFRAAAVAPGQTAQVTIPLRISDLKYWDTTSNSWKIQTGTYTIMVGPSSDQLTLKDTIVVQ